MTRTKSKRNCNVAQTTTRRERDPISISQNQVFFSSHKFELISSPLEIPISEKFPAAYFLNSCLNMSDGSDMEIAVRFILMDIALALYVKASLLAH